MIPILHCLLIIIYSAEALTCFFIVPTTVAEKVVGWAVSRHLQNDGEPVLYNGRLVITAERLVPCVPFLAVDIEVCLHSDLDEAIEIV